MKSKNASDIEGTSNLLLYALAIDAMGAVRCRDCKYYEIHKPKVLENCEQN